MMVSLGNKGSFTSYWMSSVTLHMGHSRQRRLRWTTQISPAPICLERALVGRVEHIIQHRPCLPEPRYKTLFYSSVICLLEHYSCGGRARELKLYIIWTEKSRSGKNPTKSKKRSRNDPRGAIVAFPMIAVEEKLRKQRSPFWKDLRCNAL